MVKNAVASNLNPSRCTYQKCFNLFFFLPLFLQKNTFVLCFHKIAMESV